jgi:hypothetical protein
MTTVESRPHRPVVKRTLVALGLNVVASVGLWAVASTVNTWESLTRALLILPASLGVGIVGVSLTIVSGRRGGVNRAIGIVGGLILLAPLVAAVLRGDFR